MVGRSNVGKSTLINALLKQRLARTSAAAGKTRLLNFYRVTFDRFAPVSRLYLVDLPGYGYARGGEEAQEELPGSPRELLRRRDAAGSSAAARRRPPPGLPQDVAAWDWIRTFTTHAARNDDTGTASDPLTAAVVATKIDKLSRADRRRALDKWTRQLNAPVLPVSAATGEGMNDLWTLIVRLLRPQPAPHPTTGPAARRPAPAGRPAPAPAPAPDQPQQRAEQPQQQRAEQPQQQRPERPGARRAPRARQSRRRRRPSRPPEPARPAGTAAGTARAGRTAGTGRNGPSGPNEKGRRAGNAGRRPRHAQGHGRDRAHAPGQGAGSPQRHRPAQAGADLRDPARPGREERLHLLGRRPRAAARRLRLPARPRLQLPGRPRRRLRLAVADPQVRPAHRRHRLRPDPAAQGRRALLRPDQGRSRQLRAARSDAREGVLREPDAALSAGALQARDRRPTTCRRASST